MVEIFEYKEHEDLTNSQELIGTIELGSGKMQLSGAEPNTFTEKLQAYSENATSKQALNEQHQKQPSSIKPRV